MDPKTKTFIADHVNNMDLCVHPDIINLHGATSGTKPMPQPELLPIFSLSRTALHSDVLVIPTEQVRHLRPSAARISSLTACWPSFPSSVGRETIRRLPPFRQEVRDPSPLARP